MLRRLFLLLTLTYVAASGGHAYSGDAVLMLRVTEALVTRGETAVRPIEGFESYAVATGDDDRLYAKYGLGLSLAAAPLYALGMAAENAVPASATEAFQAPRLLYYDREDKSELIRTFFTVLTNAFVTAGLLTLLAAILLRLGLPVGWAAGAAMVCGLTGALPFYAKTFFSEPLAGLLLTAAAWSVLRAGDGRPMRWLALAGLLLGTSALTRVAHGALVLPGALGLWLWARQRGLSPWRALASAGAGFGALIGGLLAYNAVRFGSALETGYGAEAGAFTADPVEGLLGLLASPGRGLLWYFPWIVPAALGARALWRIDRAVAVLSFGTLATLLALYAPWHMWEGGWCFGPRFLVPAMPLLAIPAAVWVYQQRERRGLMLAVAVVGVLSLGLAVQSVRVNYLDFHFALFKLVPDWEHALRWSLEWAPMAAYWDFPLTDFLIWPHLMSAAGGTLLAGLAWTVVAAWPLAALALGRALRRP